MAGFVYFKNPTIPGEVTQGSFCAVPSPNSEPAERYYWEWIEVNSVTQTVTRSIETGRSGTARARAGTVLEEIEIEKEMDTTTVRLIEAVAGGLSFGEVWIHLVTSVAQEPGTQSLHPYLEMKLVAVKVTNYSVNGSGLDDGSIPTETISLNFDKIQWKYWPIGPYPKAKDGLETAANVVGDIQMAGWDILKQAPYIA